MKQTSTFRIVAMAARHSPVAAAKATLIGMGAALRAPLYVSGSRLRSALEAQVDERSKRVHGDSGVVVALRVANGAVRQLARTRSAWRNTCLYRSAAQYLVLKEFGRSAAIRIGVKGKPHQDDGDVAVHSWVLHDGIELVQDTDVSYEELAFSKRS